MQVEVIQPYPLSFYKFLPPPACLPLLTWQGWGAMSGPKILGGPCEIYLAFLVKGWENRCREVDVRE